MNGGSTVCKGCFIEKMAETNIHMRKSLSSVRFYSIKIRVAKSTFKFCPFGFYKASFDSKRKIIE